MNNNSILIKQRTEPAVIQLYVIISNLSSGRFHIPFLLATMFILIYSASCSNE